MTDIIGLLNLRDVNFYHELNANRPLAAVPFAGKFRLIDFTLSSLVNADVGDIGILLPISSNSIMDHIRGGKEWNLAKIKDGLFYLPPDPDDVHIKEGCSINSYFKNMRFVDRGLKKYIILSFCDSAYNADFNKIMEEHESTKSDVTMIYSIQNRNLSGRSRTLTVDKDDNVTKISPFGNTKIGDKLFLRCLIMECKTFKEIVVEAHAEGKTSLCEEINARLDKLKVHGYKYTEYVAKIDSLADYFRASMDLLNLNIWKELFFNGDRRIHSKVKNEIPTKYLDNAKVQNSLLANGAVVDGTVENSILSRRVTIGEKAIVRNSILMQYCKIGEGAILDGVVCDKSVTISPGRVIKGTPEKPYYISKGMKL
ncbi:MAG: glucose-1-phosphate adenylyltransferase subunit GlgD [Acidaminococcaceae bacterium]|jgi:glucose-1-phosphate adenylyltransferase|nr:glucose-1-phosphate adenylyltransferase subunit GlgD [Acidaminococcaceae bacterium]